MGILPHGPMPVTQQAAPLYVPVYGETGWWGQAYVRDVVTGSIILSEQLGQEMISQDMCHEVAALASSE
jgi:hypothetical protein